MATKRYSHNIYSHVTLVRIIVVGEQKCGHTVRRPWQVIHVTYAVTVNDNCRIHDIAFCVTG